MRNNLTFILIYSIATLFLGGCNSVSKEVYPRYADFPEVRTLSQVKAISCDSVYLRYPYRVEIKDSLAVILDLHPESCFLHAFTYPDWKYVVSFGRRGEGPDEILSAERVRIISPDSVWVLDSNRRQITRWRISASSGNVERAEEILLDERLIRTLDFCKTNEGFLVTDYTGNYRYHVLDAHGQIKESVGSIPTEKVVADDGRMALAQAWRSFMDYNPENGVLAMVTQLGEVIEVFNLKTGEHREYYGPHGEPLFHISQGYGLPIGIMGFHDVKVTEHLIYAVFQGISFKEIARSEKQGIHLPDGGSKLYTFTLTGLPVKCYELGKPVCGIWVGEVKKLFLATDVFTDNLITRFDLKK